MVNDGVALRICRGSRHINLQVANSQRCTCACTLLSHKAGHVHAPSMSGCAFVHCTDCIEDNHRVSFFFFF